MERNIGNADSIIRFVIATLVGILFINNLLPYKLGLVLMIVAVIFVITSYVGICPVYRLLGYTSLRPKSSHGKKSSKTMARFLTKVEKSSGFL